MTTYVPSHEGGFQPLEILRQGVFPLVVPGVVFQPICFGLDLGRWP